MRTHIVLPEELVEEVDSFAGKRKRSRFVEEAVREKLLRARQLRVLRETAGSIDLKNHPEWSTPEKISAWVRALRDEDEQSLKEKLGERYFEPSSP